MLKNDYKDKIVTKIIGNLDPQSKLPCNIDQKLMKLRMVEYSVTATTFYEPQLELNLRNTLLSTDILLLPYESLHSTLDIPVLVLEGMASLCVILTTEAGDIPAILNDTDLVVRNDPQTIYHKVINLIEDGLQNKRNKTKIRNEILNFKSSQIGQSFLTWIANK